MRAHSAFNRRYNCCLNPCCNGIYSMSTWFDTFSSASIAQVLILVVMEYTQWERVLYGRSCVQNVLILVVMEYTQWAPSLYVGRKRHSVLILVVMEYTQWERCVCTDLELVVLILVVMEYTQWDVQEIWQWPNYSVS